MIDAHDSAVIPGFVDSHTHLVFAGERSDEFEARMSGARYDGGGIATTVAATRAASSDELRRAIAPAPERTARRRRDDRRDQVRLRTRRRRASRDCSTSPASSATR